MWAAIGYRKAQALALAALSALITACAVFAPLYERSLEQALLREGLNRADVSATAVVLSRGSFQGATPDAASVREVFPSALTSLYDGGSEMRSGHVTVLNRAGQRAEPMVYAPQDTCAGLTIVQGRCPSAAYQVLVSAAEADVQKWTVGTQLDPREVQPSVAAPPPFPSAVTVVGTFRQKPDDAHWMGISLEGRAGVYSTGPAAEPLMDSWVTHPATFERAWKFSNLDVNYVLHRDALTLENATSIPPAVDAAVQRGQAQTPAVGVRTGIREVVSELGEGQRQARVIVPLLMGQLAVLALVVLGLVAGAAVEQRRQELALARLRGRGAAGAARLLISELGFIVAAGVPVGLALALLVNAVARRSWLTPGVPFELPVTALLAALVSFVAGLLAVVVVARPTLREPISTLLRRIPPRRRGWAIGIVDAVIIAIAGAGVLTLANGNLSGPLALATPTLLALALGLLLAHLLIPVADLVGRRLTSRGRVAGGLTAVQIARRPAVRRVMTIITVATALTVFAADALVVGQRNREVRASIEAGAEISLATDGTDVQAVIDAVHRVDPTGSLATPVALVRQGDPAALETLAVIPDQFARVAFFPRDRSAFGWAALQAPLPQPIAVKGRSLSVTITSNHLTALTVRPLGGPETPNLPNLPIPVTIFVATPSGQPIPVSLGKILVGSVAPVTLGAQISCADGCQINGFGIDREFGDGRIIRGGFSLSDLRVDGGPPVEIGRVKDWTPTGSPNAAPQELRDFAAPVDVGSTTSLGFELSSQGRAVRINSSATTAPVPALVSGALPAGTVGDDFRGAALDGIAVPMRRAAQIPYAPGGQERVALVNLSSLASRGKTLGILGRLEVWLATPALEGQVRDALTGIGVRVVHETRRSDLKAAYDNAASAWGLQLALVVGIVALLIAGIVIALVAGTSWRGRARDYAALLMSGISRRLLRAVGVAEQTVVVGISVVAGVLCGLAGAQLAMPILPFFTTPSAVISPDTTPALPPVAVAAVTSLVVLLAIGTIVGRRLVSGSTLDRIQEQV